MALGGPGSGGRSSLAPLAATANAESPAAVGIGGRGGERSLPLEAVLCAGEGVRGERDKGAPVATRLAKKQGRICNLYCHLRSQREPRPASPRGGRLCRSPLWPRCGRGAPPPVSPQRRPPAVGNRRPLRAGLCCTDPPNRRPRPDGRHCGASAGTTSRTPAGAPTQGGAAPWEGRRRSPHPHSAPPSSPPSDRGLYRTRRIAVPSHEARGGVHPRHGRAKASTVGASRPPPQPSPPPCGGGVGGGVKGDMPGTAISAIASSQYHCSSSFQ